MKNKESDEIYIASVTDDGTQIFNELGGYAAGPNRPMGGFASLLDVSEAAARLKRGGGAAATQQQAAGIPTVSSMNNPLHAGGGGGGGADGMSFYAKNNKKGAGSGKQLGAGGRSHHHQPAAYPQPKHQKQRRGTELAVPTGDVVDL